MALFNPILRYADILLMLRAFLTRIRTPIVGDIVVPALIEALTSPVDSIKGSHVINFLEVN